MSAVAMLTVGSLDARQLNAEEALARVKSGGSSKVIAAFDGAEQPRLIGTRTTKDGNAIYAFSTSGSTMFVSADDSAIPLLGYTEGPLESIDNLPASMKWWLDQYVRQIEFAAKKNFLWTVFS